MLTLIIWDMPALRYFNAVGATDDGTIGEDHDPKRI